MTTFLAVFGIIAATLTPTIAIIVSTVLGHHERAIVKSKVEQVAVDARGAATSTSAKLDEIHVLVNDRLTQALERIDGLEAALLKAKER